MPLRSDGRRWLEPIDLFLHNPEGIEMARWTARNAASGPIHVSYDLASQTLQGKWRLSANARPSPLRSSDIGAKRKRSVLEFEVAFYDPVGFETRVWMPNSVVPSDGGLRGWVRAKRLGDSAPIVGKVELRAKLNSFNGLICEKPVYIVSNIDYSKVVVKDFQYVCVGEQL